MVLSDKEIRELVKTGKLIDGFKEDRLQAASYDVSAGFKVQRFKKHTKRISLISKESVDAVCEEVGIQFGYDLAPGEYILLKLNERLNMPNNLVAHIRPRTTLTKLGLVISHQHLNPRFTGYIYLGLLNASPYTIEIRPNLIVGQIVFEQIASIPTEEKWYDKKTNAKYKDEDEFIGSKVYDEIEAKVEEKYKKLIQELNK